MRPRACRSHASSDASATRIDAELPRLRVEHDLRRARRGVVDEQHFLKLDVFDDARDRSESFPRRREPHLDISGGRKDDRAADAMIRQIAQAGRIDRDAPGRLRSFVAVSQQRMNRYAQAHPPGRFRFPPMGVGLEWIGRQLDGGRGGRKELLPIDLGAERMHAAERPEHRGALAVAAPDRARASFPTPRSPSGRPRCRISGPDARRSPGTADALP